MNPARELYLMLFFHFIFLYSISQQNNFKIYTIDDGLPQSQIFSMLQDSRGYLWIGTNGGGLSRFDGTNFVTFAKKDGLSGNTIRSLLEDYRGNLWIGTENGLTFFNGLNFKSLTNQNGLSGTSVTSLAEDNHHIIYAGTNNGGLNCIVPFSKDSFQIKYFNRTNGLPNDFVFDIVIDRVNRIWLATFGGINILDLNNDKIDFKWLKCPVPDPGEMILSLAEDNQGNIYLGTDKNGAFKISLTGSDSGKMISLSKIYRFHDNTIRDIECLKNNDIWFATDKAGVEILKYNTSGFTLENFTVNTGLPANQLLKLHQDKEGNIWIGTNGSGLCRYIGDFFAHYTINEGLSSNQVFGIIQDNTYKYWIATYGGGLTKLIPQNQTYVTEFITVKNGLSDNYLTSLSKSKDGSIWIATANNGIIRFRNGIFTYFNTSDGLTDNHVNCILVDANEKVWCGTQGGISKYDGSGFLRITSFEGLINNEVQAIVEDKLGTIWFGTFGGLVKIEGQKMTDYDLTDGLSEKRINSLATDHLGNIWIGTFGGGLNKLDRSVRNGKPIKLIAYDSLLSSNNIISLLFQNDSILVVGTDRGFDKLYFDRNQKIISVSHYDKSNGFSGMENNINAIYKDNKGLIWFGTVKGLTRYNPFTEIRDMNPPQTHIVDLNLFFERINWENRTDSVKPWFNLPQELRLPHYKNHLTFKFIGISLSNPSKISYSFKLEGWDRDWSPGKKITEITYSGLAPGKYTFKVKAENEKGIWNKEPITFSFEITPPFWKTYWFFVFCILSFVAIIVIYIKNRERKLVWEKRKLEMKVAERTKEVMQQKLEIEQKNKDILDSIEYAKRIQDALLPNESILGQVFDDYFILFKPRNIVSGDFYWITVASDKLILAVADCTGHGVPGAFMSMLGVAFLNEIVKKESIDQADLILDQLRIHVLETLHNASDGMDMSLCIFDLKNKNMQYAGAYSPGYLLRNFELIELKPDKMPIGFHLATDEISLFKKTDFELHTNDVIYLFSDGYKDQYGGPDFNKIKASLFRHWLIEIHQLPMNEQKNVLNNRFEEWKSDTEQTDDVCVVGIRIK
jgi:ligand-binding sensor domain-containing protein/serine phosphatase RsbU (regulator of sigma subunit)